MKKKTRVFVFHTCRQAEFEDKVDKNDKEQMSLLEEMRRHVKKLEDLRKHEDPRLSFSTPEFREAQRIFTDNFKKNFGRAIEWGMVRRYPWSSPQLVRLDVPVDPEGNPWPLDEDGKPIEREDPTLHREVSSYKE